VADHSRATLLPRVDMRGRRWMGWLCRCSCLPVSVWSRCSSCSSWRVCDGSGRGRAGSVVGRAPRWTVTSRPVLDWASRLPGQHRRGVSLMVSGTVRGWHVAVAEYSYTTESMADSRGSRSTTTHYLLVIAVRVTASYAPIAVHARGGLSRLGRAMFGDNAAATATTRSTGSFGYAPRIRGCRPRCSARR